MVRGNSRAILYKKGKQMGKKLKKKYNYLKYLLFVLPGLLVWFVFSLLPNIQIFYFAFIKWNGISAVKEFVGLDNLKNMLHDPFFITAFQNSIIYIIVLMVVQNSIALFLAIILRGNTRINKFFRTFFFSPLVLSTVIVAMIWGYMYDPNFGMINTFLHQVKLDKLAMNWLGTPVLSIVCVVLVHIWHNMGYPLTIILAGMQTIPETLYEAAKVDGAKKGKILTAITIPLLLPTLLRVSLLTIIGGTMAFDYTYALGSGGTAGVNSKLDTLSVFMYKSISNKQSIGFSAAIGLTLTAFVFVIFIIQFIASKKVEDSIN